ncbi:MAG: mechanosensitive ion channel domain-containing protein [Candidatus Tectomicrobia bacterium]
MGISTRQIMLGLITTLSLVSSVGYVSLAQPEVPEPLVTLLQDIESKTHATQKATTQTQQALRDLSAQLQTLQARQEQEQQDFHRLRTLIDTYGRSAHIAQRLHVARTRLKHERARHRETQVTTWESQVQALAETALQLDENLYRFEDQSAARLDRLQTQLSALPVAQQDVHLAAVRQAIASQQAAWRDHAQVVAAQTRTLTELITQHRERQDGLNERYRFLLAKTFWMRDSPPVDGALIREAFAGVTVTATRLRLLLQSEWARLKSGFSGSFTLWILLVAAFVLLPWLASRARRYLRTQVEAAIARDIAHDHFGAKMVAVLLMILQTLIWPLYIALIAWVWPSFLPGFPEQPTLHRALVSGLQWLAFLLWLDLLAQAITRRSGWGEHYLRLPREPGQIIRRTVSIGCLAALLLMIPRYILLAAPGVPDMKMAEQSLMLARLCFLVFQVVFLVLMGISCRRGSPVIGMLLSGSQAQNGGLWRAWPLIHGVLVLGLAAVLVLDVQGFCYASRSLWLVTVWALVTILALLVIYGVLSALIQYLIRQQQQREDEEDVPDPTQPGRIAVLQQGHRFAGLMLILIGVIIIQHLYGFDTELFSVVNTVQLLNISSDAAAPVWLTLGDVLKALLILMGMFLVTRNTPCLCEVCLFPHVSWDGGFRYAFRTLLRYAVILFGIWWSLTVLHMNWSSIQWVLAAASVGLGFGLQEIVSNFISGLILLVERPISVGDIVTVGSESGTVTRITIRATFLLNRANQVVIVPNKAFITSEVTNAVRDDPAMRIVVPVGVAYGSDLELVKTLILEAASNHVVVQELGRPVLVHFRGFGDSSLDWELRFFVPAPGNRLGVTHDILLEIDRRFREHGIEIPFPQRDVHVQMSETRLPTPAQSDGTGAENSVAITESGTEEEERKMTS